MPKGIVYQGIVAFPKATAWGTAVAGGATHGLKVLSAPLQANRALIPNMSIQAMPTQTKSETGNKVIQGDVYSAELTYEGFEPSIAGVFGTAGVPATVDTTARQHDFKIKTSLAGIFFTLAYEIIKDTLIYEFNTVKLTGITVRWAQNGRVEISLRGIAHDWSDASAINTTTTIDTVTVPANSQYGAVFRQIVVRMNATSAGALGASDVRFISAGEISMDRNLQPDFNTEFGDRTSEPHPPTSGDSFTKVSGSLTFSQLDTASPGGSSGLPATQMAGTDQKIDVVITGDALAGAATEKFSHKHYLPCIQMGDGKPHLGGLGWTVPFTGYHVGAAPTGFPAGFTDAWTWRAVSQRAADALA